MLLNEFLEQSAGRFPDKVALCCQEKRFTFADVERGANALGHFFVDQGLEKQDRAAVFLENSFESAIALFGILKAGGVFVVINPQVKARKFEYILNDCQIRVLVTDTRHLSAVAEALPRCPHLSCIVLAEDGYGDESLGGKRIYPLPDCLARYPSHCPKKRVIDIDLASLIYTSGSTGGPKGVMLTHGNMVAAAASITEYLENTSDDIILNSLPLSFDYGLYQVLMAMKFGGTVILEKSFTYPYRIIDLIIKEKVTGFPIVPTVAAILMQLKNLEKCDFSHLRYITNTAQALAPKQITRLRELFPRTRIYSMYGLTECKRVSYLSPEELSRRPTSVGKAMPNTEAYIVDEYGQRITAPGVVGELVVRGANVMKGYWNLPEETGKRLRPGVHPGEKVLFTGDYFKTDEEGYLYFVARKDDLIKTAGERVSPKEVENALYEIDDVVEAAVVGVDDETLGKAIKAFVVRKEGSALTEKDVLAHCARTLESFMVPRTVEFLPALPKTLTGKIQKQALAGIAGDAVQ